MKVVFRVDASLEIGTGHVMRCLTLADALRAKGAQCYFISRDHIGNMLEKIYQHNFTLNVLPPSQSGYQIEIDQDEIKLAYARWLGCSWQTDSKECCGILHKIQPDWLIVDHYAIDARWQVTLKPYYRKLLVIDDLADRSHQCDLLLDQNLGRQERDYAHLLPKHSQSLLGPQYALLRPEFAEWREYSLKRRNHQQLKRLLITMGGIDQPNATGQVLEALQLCALPRGCQINVVMGTASPWLTQIYKKALQMPWPTKIWVDITNMAQRMADSDLAIGAAGSTSWERCCLGLPTLAVVLAENQWPGARALQTVQAVELLGRSNDIARRLPSAMNFLQQHASALRDISSRARDITDGLGVGRVLSKMEQT